MPAMPLATPANCSPTRPGHRMMAQPHARATDEYRISVSADDCLIRAVLVESIDCLFSELDVAESAGRNDPMDEPLLDHIDDQRVQFHGQLTAPPRARRRQKLVASRAVFHTVVRR
jgi:hypothetical protein